jgi:sugar/nucleoside kinase (ribokinase family)
MLLCALGDLLLDVVVRLERPLVRGDDTPAATVVGAGGQAANVAAWAAALGAEARLITKRGDDNAARLAADDLLARGVELVGPVEDGAGGVVVSVVSPDEERSMLSDRGPAPALRADELDVTWLRGCTAFHLSGYAMLRGPIVETGAKAAGAARAQGARISVDLASAEGIRDAGAERVLSRLELLAPNVVFGGTAELEALGREPRVETLVVKLGPAGAAVVREGSREEHEALPTTFVDPTGAVDALAAGFLVGGIELGLDAAARCVAKPGAMP